MIHRKAADTVPAPIETGGAEGIRYARLIGLEHGAPNVILRHFFIDEGGHSPRHAHPWEHEVYVLSGAGSLTTASGETRLAPGDSVLVAPDEEHQFKAGTGGLAFLCIVPPEGDAGMKTERS